MHPSNPFLRLLTKILVDTVPQTGILTSVFLLLVSCKQIYHIQPSFELRIYMAYSRTKLKMAIEYIHDLFDHR